MSKEIGENLVRLRKQKGQTQKAVAEAIDTKHGTYTSWERGLANPGVESLIKLSKYFGVLVDDLVCNDNWNKIEDGLPEELSGPDCKLRLWICIDNFGSQLSGIGTFKDGVFKMNNSDVTEFVTHWRPTPQLPRS